MERYVGKTNMQEDTGKKKNYGKLCGEKESQTKM
jgi:hypothetical protein